RTFAAATSGAWMAVSQCSTLIRLPNRRDQNAAQSPAAKTPGTEARSPSSTPTPLPSSPPDPPRQPPPRPTPTPLPPAPAARRPPRAGGAPPPAGQRVPAAPPGSRRRAQPQAAPGGGVPGHGPRPGLRAERARQRGGRHFQHGDLAALLGGAGGQFGADPAGPDPGQLEPGPQRRAQHPRVVEGTQDPRAPPARPPD